jgi:uncharacterized protein YbjT (DUF2867 family)
MAPHRVIVFGPTGAVGSAAARTAQDHGAQVVLAMRDTTKAIRGLDAEVEKQGNFERTYADLTKPNTVRDAVNKTGAKYAFMYLAQGTSDHMKSTIEALKNAGIKLVVFLSSFTVRGELEAIEPSAAIPYLHAQVEINLRTVFGPDGFVAARPGSFASNTFQYKKGLQEGLVKIHGPDAKVDCIVPEDIGRVCGTVLAKGPQDEERALYIYGPKVLAQKEVVEILAKALGKSVKVEAASKEDAYKTFVEERKVPAQIARYMVDQVETLQSEAGLISIFGYRVEEEQLSNVQRYSEKKATTFEEWAEQNKHIFSS